VKKLDGELSLFRIDSLFASSPSPLFPLPKNDFNFALAETGGPLSRFSKWCISIELRLCRICKSSGTGMGSSDSEARRLAKMDGIVGCDGGSRSEMGAMSVLAFDAVR